MPHQDSDDQLWYPASRYLDLCALRRFHPVLSLEDFAAAANASGAMLPHFHFPPYLLPRRDTPSYSGALFAAHGLRFAAPRQMVAHAEATQATSGRAEVPYARGEGLGFWRAAASAIQRTAPAPAPAAAPSLPSLPSLPSTSSVQSPPVPAGSGASAPSLGSWSECW